MAILLKNAIISSVRALSEKSLRTELTGIHNPFDGAHNENSYKNRTDAMHFQTGQTTSSMLSGRLLTAYGLVFNTCFVWGCTTKAPKWDRNMFLKKHNEYREMVRLGRVPNQPAAVNMKNLTWSSKLENDAKAWAMRCVFKHVDKAYSSDGENLGASTDINSDPVLGWYDEYKLYRFGPISTHNFAATGHYTQLVWEKTNEVGCYRYLCPYLYMSQGAPIKSAYFSVCRYSPAPEEIRDLPETRDTSLMDEQIRLTPAVIVNSRRSWSTLPAVVVHVLTNEDLFEIYRLQNTVIHTTAIHASPGSLRLAVYLQEFDRKKLCCLMIVFKKLRESLGDFKDSTITALYKGKENPQKTNSYQETSLLFPALWIVLRNFDFSDNLINLNKVFQSGTEDLVGADQTGMIKFETQYMALLQNNRDIRKGFISPSAVITTKTFTTYELTCLSKTVITDVPGRGAISIHADTLLFDKCIVITDREHTARDALRDMVGLLSFRVDGQLNC
ncbi:peptidase inhibitor 16 [Clonorchis sinensis]|uniref:Peptidase inhibitor 16 n=1 Tax=Clonorchis sinensis TaxID=79923 RepID=H2KV48_CLOSI|nr:peptidase inhibitor 16 [Clonorchis sinensis]